MKKILISLCLLLLVPVGYFLYRSSSPRITSGSPPYQVVNTLPSDGEIDDVLQDWTRPSGPPKVGLQVGHWKNDEVPDELKNLRGNTGASGGGKSEWEVNYEIATKTKELLEKQGIVVDMLAATIPENYWADVFVAIHADGNEDPTMTGFKAAIPRRDLTGNADELLAMIESSYQEATGLSKDPNISRNMRGYYAFGWWRYTHTVHPMTTSLILETGFLTSPADRTILVDHPEESAGGLANGIIAYLDKQKLLAKD